MIVGITMQQPSSEVHQPPHEANGMHNEEVEEKHVSELPYESEIHPNMNGNMPPQQVYVHPGMGHPGMTGLESQFQALGFRQEEASSTEPSSTQTNPNADDEDDHEGDDGEDDPLKLFVGQVSAANENFQKRSEFKLFADGAREPS